MKIRFFTFCGVGVINTLIDFSVFNFLIYIFGISDWLIVFNIISYSISILNSFILNSRITFKREVKISNFGKFYGIMIFGLVLNTSIVGALSLIYRSFLYLNVYKIIACMIVAFINYMLCRTQIFSESK